MGSLSVRVTATDSSGAAVYNDLTVTVNNTNDAPTVANAIANQSVNEDSALNFQVPSNTFSDVDVGDTLTYSATLADGTALPSWLSFDAATQTFSGTPGNDEVGSLSVRVIAMDGSSTAAHSDFTLTINNTNDARQWPMR